ncbi:MAG: S-adenosylmethionine:tRNA ribosyltransferase-isomerase [Solirubrobacteraceae bacterium]
MRAAVAFELPAALEAREPPEARGLARDEVRLLIAGHSDASIRHARFRDLPAALGSGDLLVVNDSATVPAAVAAERGDGSPVRVHFATRAPELPDTWCVVELRSADGAHRGPPGRAGERLALAGGATLELVAPYASSVRMMLAVLESREPLLDYLASHGDPVRYGYVKQRRPLSDYQNVYATTPGSAEMPSAGRPFSFELLARLADRGVLVAPITLHAGVSSPERHEPPFAEYYCVPDFTARIVTAVRSWGGRVIAVGTTVVRALETVAGEDGRLSADSGWTNLVITPERRLRVVDGLITGWHEPEASHLQMLEAVGGRALLERSYSAALEQGYLWHEFGDSHLILP